MFNFENKRVFLLIRCSPKLLRTGFHHSYQESSPNLMPTKSSNSHMMQQRSLSTNILLVNHDKPSPINISVLTNRHSTNNKLVTSTSFTRTASKKRREFGKEKRNVSSNVDPSYPITDEHQTTVHQVKLKIFFIFRTKTKFLFLLD